MFNLLSILIIYGLQNTICKQEDNKLDMLNNYINLYKNAAIQTEII